MSTAGTRARILFLTRFGILLAIEAIVCFTPLGSLPAFGIVATLSMIPVIVTAILLGTPAGALMGFFFGLFSLLKMTYEPMGPTAMVFTPFYSVGEFSGNGWSLVICFVPRILLGVVAGLCFQGLSRTLGTEKLGFLTFGISGLLGSLTNTFGVLGGIYIFFGPAYEQALITEGAVFNTLLGLIALTIATNGVFEAVISFVVAAGVCMPLYKYQLRRS